MDHDGDALLADAVMGFTEINREMAGRQMARNLANSYAGLRHLSQQIAPNSEQMLRENLQVMINDHDWLCTDPLLAGLCGKKDPLGQDWLRQRDRGKPLTG